MDSPTWRQGAHGEAQAQTAPRARTTRGNRALEERQAMKRTRYYYKRAIKRHYGGELRGLAHEQLNRQRGFLGTTLGPANKGRRLSDAERQAIEQRMRDDGRLRLALLEADWQRGNHAKIGSMASDAELSGDAAHRAIPLEGVETHLYAAK